MLFCASDACSRLPNSMLISNCRAWYLFSIQQAILYTNNSRAWYSDLRAVLIRKTSSIPPLAEMCACKKLWVILPPVHKCYQVIYVKGINLIGCTHHITDPNRFNFSYDLYFHEKHESRITLNLAVFYIGFLCINESCNVFFVTADSKQNIPHWRLRIKL